MQDVNLQLLTVINYAKMSSLCYDSLMIRIRLILVDNSLNIGT